MKLRGIEFGPVWGASGVQGFFGEEYSFHSYYKSLFPFGFDFSGMTFTAKTVTLLHKAGNLQVEEDWITPKETFPDCIRVKFFQGVVLNAVGLTNPGIRFMLEEWRWQKRTEPFFLSFAPVTDSPEQRLKELQQFIYELISFVEDFNAKFSLQLNFSCPNSGVNIENVVDEVNEWLSAAEVLEIPLVLKISASMPVSAAVAVSQHKACDALCIGNTIPWGQFSGRIDWQEIFGSDVSPLEKYGGGGLSGAPLLPIAADWIRAARNSSLKKPINACGGILCPQDLELLKNAGADSVSLGSIAILRPWRVRKTIKKAHELFQ